jgi:hypothetical protein
MGPVKPHSINPVDEALRQLKNAEEELDQIKQQLSSFEARVDAHLGSMLDQLSELNQETANLDAQLRHIREEQLYGKERMSYQQGAPQPARQTSLRDLPPMGIHQRDAIHAKGVAPGGQELMIPDIKGLYRKLARRYHPDLALSEADRAASHAQMIEINRAYQAGDMKTLLRLAGIGLPYGVELPQAAEQGSFRRNGTMSEAEQVQQKLKAVREQIAQMSSLPIVKLSLEVKLAEHAGRNLLGEMAADLQYKLRRKQAERDYLQAQIRASQARQE